MKYIYLFTITLLFSFSSLAQIQLGNDIDGESWGDRSGGSVSLSADGSIVAIGAILNDGNDEEDAGHVRVFQYMDTSWVQLGNDIDGEWADENCGLSVSLSANGNIVAVSSPRTQSYINGKWKYEVGHVRVFQYNDTNWVQLGNDIDGEAAGDESGNSVSLSADGSIVAIGAMRNDGNGDDAGHVRVFQFMDTSWVQLGDDIDGEDETDWSGYSVSLSADGSIVAIGAKRNSHFSTWHGHVRVFQYMDTSWVQLGNNLDGEATGDWSGGSVSLSADGSIVAIGAKLNDGNGDDAGHVRVFQYNGTSWVQLGYDLDGEATGDESGYSVSLSADGSIVAIGAILNDGNGSRSGHVRVYEICGYAIDNQPRNVTMPIGKTAVIGLESNHKLYQWQTDVGFGFQNIMNVGQFAGVDENTLSIMELSMMNHNQHFRCLVQTEGCKDTSEVAVLNVDGNVGMKEVEHSFKVYPIPTSKELNIKVEFYLLGSIYSILDPLGRALKQGELTKLHSSIDVSELSKGYYLLRIGEVTSYKFLIQ